MCHFLFLNFFGTISGVGSSTPGPSKAEKLIGSGKKKIAITSRGTVFRGDTKKNKKKTEKKNVSGMGDVSQGLCLSMFQKNMHLWKPGAY